MADGDTNKTSNRRGAVNPTEDAYGELSLAYDYFNEALFDGRLPGALITLTRKRRTCGYFSAVRWASRDGKRADEIAMNPAYFASQPIEDVLSTLVHEQVHQEQFHFYDPGRSRYHNREFARLMERIGLIASDTGKPGGNPTGDAMDHWIVEDGPFDRACAALLTEAFRLSWYDRYAVTTATRSEPNRFPAGSTRWTPPAPPRPAGNHLEEDDWDEEAGGEDGEIVLLGLNPDGVPIVTVRDKPDAGADDEDGVEGTQMPTAAGPTPALDVVEDAPRPGLVPRSNRVKYSCSGCGINAWGKPALRLGCLDCSQPLEPVQGAADS